MKFITLFAALAAAVPAAFGLTINTPPSVVECEPTQFTWSGGTSPYFLSLQPAGQTSATPLMQFPTQSGTSYTWNVNLQSGTSFTIALKDSTGATAYSDIVTIQAGSSSSCINSSGSSGAASATSGSGSSAGTTAAAAGTTAAAAGSSAGSSATASGSATSSASSSTSSSTSGAGRLGVSSAFGVAGLMGLVGAALF